MARFFLDGDLELESFIGGGATWTGMQTQPPHEPSGHGNKDAAALRRDDGFSTPNLAISESHSIPESSRVPASGHAHSVAVVRILARHVLTIAPGGVASSAAIRASAEALLSNDAIRLAWLLASNAFSPSPSHITWRRRKKCRSARRRLYFQLFGDMYCIVPTSSLRCERPAHGRGRLISPARSLRSLPGQSPAAWRQPLSASHCWFQIAMHHALRCALSRASAIWMRIATDRRWAAGPFQSELPASPLEILHHQIFNSVLVANVIERANVRMIQAGDSSRLTLERCRTSGVSASPLRRILMATVRSRRVSRARYTSPSASAHSD